MSALLAPLSLALVAAPTLQSTATAPIGSGPEAVGDPASWITIMDYPTAAIRAEHEGRSIVEVMIDTNGRGVRCRVLHTSGVVALDQAGCAALMRRGRWRATLDSSGQPVFAVLRRQIYWSHLDRRQQSAAKMPMPPDVEVDVAQLPVGADKSTVVVRQIQSADGRIESCIVAVPSASPALDAAACGAAATLAGHDLIYDVNGAAVRGARWRRVQFREASRPN